MGGGTFDVALCRLSPGRVEVLCNKGNGERGLGIAGAHFDHELLKAKLGDDLPTEVRVEFLVELDRKKKSTDSTNRLLTNLQVSPDERPLAPIYTIHSMLAGRTVSFSFDDVCAAFEPVRAGINEVLGKVKREAERRGYPIDKVVLVGGFSKFPLVQQAVGEFFGEDVFGSRTLIDLDTLSRDDMAFAISYGSCLVANELVEVSEKYEHTVGIIVTNAAGQDEEVELIASGKSLDALAETTYCTWDDGRRRRFRITRDTVEPEIFIRLFGSRAAADKLVSRLALSDVPNSHLPGNRWFLGAYVDRSKIPYLVIEDEKGEHRKRKIYPLGDIIPDIIMEGA
jgi:molecular chaperone DnaK